MNLNKLKEAEEWVDGIEDLIGYIADHTLAGRHSFTLTKRAMHTLEQAHKALEDALGDNNPRQGTDKPTAPLSNEQSGVTVEQSIVFWADKVRRASTDLYAASQSVNELSAIIRWHNNK